MQTKYPEIFTGFITNILIACLLIGFIIIILILYQKKKLMQEKEIETMKSVFDTELLKAQLEIQEEVMKNISQEIHDNIGQIMLLANVNVSILQTMSLPTTAPELIRDTKQLLSKAIEDISHLSRGLHSERVTEIGVFNAIKYELETLKHKGLYTVTITDCATSENLLQKETQIILFRMFQEILNNIIKHAQASHIDLIIRENEEAIEVVIIDNGIGFEFNTSSQIQPSYNGVGLRSLHSRVNLFEGKITIDSILQKGTNICIFIPVKKHFHNRKRA